MFLDRECYNCNSFWSLTVDEEAIVRGEVICNRCREVHKLNCSELEKSFARLTNDCHATWGESDSVRIEHRLDMTGKVLLSLLKELHITKRGEDSAIEKEQGFI